MNFIAIGPKGNTLATFNALDLALAYQADRAAIGVAVTIRRAIEQRRRAA